MRGCPSCGTSFQDSASFCPEDGSELPEPDPLLGRTVGSYRVMRLLGKGGMGAVYLGQHPLIGSKVAIKFLHPRYSHDRRAVSRFFNEAKAVNVVGHDNIVHVVDLSTTEDGIHYLVMEYLEGVPLDARIREAGVLPVEVLADVAIQCCEALHCAHELGIIHRDLKPENIFLVNHAGKADFVKLVDFGVAKLNDPVPGVMRTGAGMVMGTPSYMSPEQALGEPVDGRTDIYSMGIILFEMATGELPFTGTEIATVMVAQVKDAPPRPRDLNPDLPEALEAVILKALAKHAHQRQQSMEELRVEIGAALGMTLPALPPVPHVDLESSDPSGEQATLSGFNDRATRPAHESDETLPPDARQTLLAAAKRPSRKRQYVGLGVALLGLVIAVGIVRGGADSGARPLARRAAKKAPAEAAAVEQVTLLVASSPSGVQVSARWEGGQAAGPTPLQLSVPTDAVVKLDWSARGFAAGSTELIADRSRALMLELHALPSRALAAQHRTITEADLAVPAGPPRTMGPTTEAPAKKAEDAKPKKKKSGVIEQPKGDDDSVYGEDIFEPVEEM